VLGNIPFSYIHLIPLQLSNQIIKHSVSVVCCAVIVTIYLIIISVIIQIFKMSSHEKLFLIGYMNHQITGSKLPSRGDCLKVLFYNIRITKLNLNNSTSLVIEECIRFWKKARIPTQVSHICKSKLIKLYEEWKVF
jgi:hypothetical protein